jgi:cyanophycinase
VIATWRRHSCLPCRDSSRHFSINDKSCRRQPFSRAAIVLTLAIATSEILPAQQKAYDYYLTGNPADASPQTRPGFVLAGGGKDVDAAMRWLLERSGGGDIVVLRASGGDGYNRYLFDLAPVDSVESIVFKSREASSNPFVLGRILKAEALFFAGGDQWRYVDFWRGTPVEHAIHELIRRGVPVGGTSAGLAILGEYAFSAQHDTIHSPEALADPFDARVTLTRDFLKIPALARTLTDSHFAARDRMGRLAVFLARLMESGVKAPRGLGVDERTAALLEPAGAIKVTGEGAAFVLTPTAPPESMRPLTFRGIGVRRIDAAGESTYSVSVESGKFTSRYK